MSHEPGRLFVAPPRGSKGRARTKVFREVSATIAQVREGSGSEPCSGPDGAGRQAMAQRESESMGKKDSTACLIDLFKKKTVQSNFSEIVVARETFKKNEFQENIYIV